MEYQSISFSEKDFWLEVVTISTCFDHGSFITIERLPNFMNVELFPDIHGDNKTTAVNVSRRPKWKGGSIKNDRRMVVSISVTPIHQLKYRACSINVGGGYNFPPINSSAGRISPY